MAHDPRVRNDEKRRRRADGVTIAPAPGSRKALVALLGAAVLAGLAILVLVWGTRPEPEPSRAAAVLAQADDVPAAAPAQPTRHKPRAHPVPTRVPGAAPAPEPEVAPGADEAKKPEEGEPAAEAPGFVPSGIGLFPPRGTDPIKVGIIVPEGFELPEGYLRHYQVTDDGQDLPPILMFHPDYDWVDETGQHVDVSQDRVVPPELVPEGMPIEYLEPPAESSGP